MKRIGILFDDSKIIPLDLSNPTNGNPGIGGTEYCFAMLIYYCSYYLKQYKVMVFHYNEQVRFSDNVENIIIDSEKWESIDKNSIDILVFRAGAYETTGLLGVLKRKQIKGVAWAHNYLSFQSAEILAKSSCVKKVVFVSAYMYNHYSKHRIGEKAIYIYNFVVGDEFALSRSTNYQPIVVYAGSIIPMKGFHLLAKEWKYIAKKIPKAKLYVIGSGQLYFSDSVMGKYGIAEEIYERRFMHYLLDKNGKILDSVVFCGKMGTEKNDIYRKAAVGVMNPSGRSETFGLSAVEMEFVGVPVVTYDRASYRDIIEDDKTGYLCHSRNEFRKRIISLLNDKENNLKMGLESKRFTKSKFNSEKTILDWDKIFQEILVEKEDTTIPKKEGLSLKSTVFISDAIKDIFFVVHEQIMKYVVRYFKY